MRCHKEISLGNLPVTWKRTNSLRLPRTLTRRRAQQVPPAEVQKARVSQNLRLAQEQPVLENVTINVEHVTGQTVSVGFKTVPGNHPKDNNNKMTIWQGSEIDWRHPDLGVTQLVDNNDSEGTYIMDGLELSKKDYIVGYSVTGEVKGICASAIAKGGDMLLLAPTSITLEIGAMEPGKLEIEYATLRGYKPLTNGNWLGLWRGDIDPFDPPGDPEEWHLPADDVNAGSVIFTTKLREHTTYNVVYFMGDKDNQKSNTTLAAVLRFDTA